MALKKSMIINISMIPANGMYKRPDIKLDFERDIKLQMLPCDAGGR